MSIRSNGLCKRSFSPYGGISNHINRRRNQSSTTKSRYDDLFPLTPSLEAEQARRWQYRQLDQSYRPGQPIQLTPNALQQNVAFAHRERALRESKIDTDHEPKFSSPQQSMKRFSRKFPRVSLHLAAAETQQYDGPDQGRQTLQLSNDTELSIQEAVVESFKIPTGPALGIPQVPMEMRGNDFFEYIQPYLHYVRHQEPNYLLLWSALNEILPADTLNPFVRTPKGTIRYLQHLSHPTAGPGLKTGNRTVLHHAMAMLQFPVQPSKLLPEGTDERFLPGPAHVWPHRLWASGGLTNHRLMPMRLSSIPPWTLHVLEQPISLRVEGHNREQKAFVTVLRKWYQIHGDERNRFAYTDAAKGLSYTAKGVIAKFSQAPTYLPDGSLVSSSVPAMVEEYTLCFLRKPPNLSPAQLRIVSPPGNARFHHELRISRHLLFSWSSITQNAHLIHLDEGYARSLGAPNLVVHGSLTTFIALEWAHRTLTQLAREKGYQYFFISDVSYKCLQPIFVDQHLHLKMKQSARPTPGTLGSTWDVWIEKSPKKGVTTLLYKAKVKLTVQELPQQVDWFPRRREELEPRV